MTTIGVLDKVQYFATFSSNSGIETEEYFVTERSRNFWVGTNM